MSIQTLDYLKESVAGKSAAAKNEKKAGRGVRSQSRLIDKFDINDINLNLRKEFLRLGEQEQEIMAELVPWAEEHGARIVKRFYDWQFSFSRTLDYFEQMSEEKQMSMQALRSHLESAQTQYFVNCFTGAWQAWGLDYFESRLGIGSTHDRINLPFKWYVGAYAELLNLSREYLEDSFDDEDYVNRAYDALLKVFLLDMQAVGDSFILNTVDALGFEIDTVQTSAVSDRTEHLDQVKERLFQVKVQNADYEGQLDAINRSQAVIEFSMDGIILNANENFLQAMGYTLDEVKGQHHRIFADPVYAQSQEYKEFWKALGKGEFSAGQFRRLGKNDKEIWIQASYNPIFDPDGVPFKVVKYATDITEQVKMRADFEGQLAAISKSQAVIEFELDGTIRYANENFLSVMGYTLEEVQGQHHRIFAEPIYAQSQEYKDFWARLGRGEYSAGEYKRIDKDGKEVWIQASYNPILDANGKPFKVVKYATDITEQITMRADFQGQLAAIDKSQAVIEFEVDGTIRHANANFLNALGYSLDEIKGRHHRMFVDKETANSVEYRQFWSELARGEFHSGEFKRVAKDGESVWIQASYNPILDPNGLPFKVVKYASDVTEQVKAKNYLQQSIDSMLKVVNAASKGDLTFDIDVTGQDAIGKMGDGLRHFLENLKETISQIDDSAQLLASASEELSAVSNKMGENAGETSSQANVVAAAAEQVSSNIQTVATGAEEMTASIRSVASNADEASRVANEAVEAAEQTNLTVTKLGESSTEIGKVIKVITSIAQQTNLLALNATIEAARAGEAGKGFAVVANEVKELAKQTAQATEEISQKIEAIQTDTQGAVQAISHISSIIGQINEIQGSIAIAVEEQSSTTSEIARNVNEAAKGSTEIAENITTVAMAAQSTSSGAEDTQNATNELARMANTLQGIVAQFKY